MSLVATMVRPLRPAPAHRTVQLGPAPPRRTTRTPEAAAQAPVLAPEPEPEPEPERAERVRQERESATRPARAPPQARAAARVALQAAAVRYRRRRHFRCLRAICSPDLLFRSRGRVHAQAPFAKISIRMGIVTGRKGLALLLAASLMRSARFSILRAHTPRRSLDLPVALRPTHVVTAAQSFALLR